MRIEISEFWYIESNQALQLRSLQNDGMGLVNELELSHSWLF